MIIFNNVTKIYPGSKIPAIRDLTTEITRGEFVFLVGPSGAGKSTFIKLLFREQLPTKGTIYFEGKNIARLTKGQLLRHRRQIGMVFQDFRLLKQKTVYENVAFALEVLGRSPRVIRQKFRRPGQGGAAYKENPFLRSCPAASSSVSASPALVKTR